MEKKVPVRLCLGCNASRPKRELIRIVRNKEGAVSVDFTGKASGRGAYICNDIACLEKLQKNKRLARQFGCDIAPEIYARLGEEIKNGK